MAKKEREIKSNYNDFIIGIDVSLNDSGVSVYSLSKRKIVFTGHCNVQHIRNLKKYRGYNLNAIKLNVQKEYFEDIRRRFPPRIVVFERGFAKFKKEVASLNQINGILYSIFWNYTQVQYPPTTVKAEIVNGKAEKDVVRDILLANIPELEGDDTFFNNDNVSDAVAVLVTHLLKEGIYKKANWDKKEYVQKVPKKKKQKMITKNPNIY